MADPGTNRLANETSAYLRQHMHNPVDWYPWGEEAFARARDEDKPLLVSIGYSACHWCHVMAHESFEHDESAALMNDRFVNIKVDREERPDVDQIYMDTVVRLTGHGGWPLTVFCTPDGRPFYAGTYYPLEPRGQGPTFRQILNAVSDSWQKRRDEVEESAGQILEALAAQPDGDASGTPGIAQLVDGTQQLMQAADFENGGFGQGPKFPTPTNLDLLLASLDYLPDSDASGVRAHLLHTAHEMARRGLYDHVGGGFHRYCVDGDWTIPHFEKMLYDQGLLLRFYAELHRRTGDDELIWPMRETIAYLQREMRGPEGGFYASQDADSEGEEGKFYVWTPAELSDVLGDTADEFMSAYGVDEQGNFENGTTHLIDRARRLRDRFEVERGALLAVRNQRTPPATDTKRVTSWNGYAISGLARAASQLGDDDVLREAVAAAEFVLETLRDDSGQLLRVFAEGRAHVTGFLDDYGSML
ncbi:MAG: thioredoxin domain-containing protein, partial [Myxococcota bacterium]